MPDAFPASHLRDTQIAALLHGELPAGEQRAAECHLETCPACLDRLEKQAGADRFKKDFHPGLPRQAPGLRLLEAGERLGDYLIERQIAAGGTAVVYQAREAGGARRLAALKVLQPSLYRRAESVQRFLLEAKVGSHVQDPGILPVWRVEAESEPPWLALPFVEGETLQARLDRQAGRPLPLAEVLRISQALASALRAAHEAGVIHRDVKPSNVLLATEGAHHERLRAVYLVDFGLARLREEEAGLTKTGLFLGTPQFMSPEQAAGAQDMDVGTDLFSLGVVLYLMTTGRPPFAGETFGALAESVREKAPEPPASLNPELPRWLSNLILRLLAKDPSHRPPSAAEVLAVLQTARNLGTVTSWRLVGKSSRLRRLRQRVAGAAALLLLASASLWLWAERTGRVSWVNALLAGHNGRFLYIVGRWGTYGSLPEAVEAARAGDIIEIRTDTPPSGQGWLRVPPGKPLTLRAARGFRPVLNVIVSGWPPAGVLESDFVLQGMEIRHLYRGPRPGRLLEMRGARLTLVDCRLTRAEHPPHVADSAGHALLAVVNSAEVRLERCDLSAPGSPLIGVEHTEADMALSVALTDCRLQGGVLWCDQKAPARLVVRLERCEVSASHLLHFRYAMPAEKLTVAVENCSIQVTNNVLTAPKPLAELARVLEWRGRGNRYLTEGRMVLAQDGGHLTAAEWMAAMPEAVRESDAPRPR